MASRVSTRVPWREKLRRGEAQIVEIPPNWRKRYGEGSMVIARPLDVDAFVRRIPKGRTATLSELRAELARQYGVSAACPLTTGIFLRIVAEAAEEERRAGKRRIAPWWRIVRDDGALLERSPGGAAWQARLLEEEGHRVVSRGKKLKLAPC